MPLPNFFLVGAPKSGTTALFSYLEQHPDVYVPIEKEPHFFSPDMVAHTSRNYTLAEYSRMFDGAKGQKRIGEASTLYLSSEVAAREIKALVPDAKIVASLRNPIDVVFSFHHHTLYSATHVQVDPSDPMAACHYLFLGRYASQLERYFSELGRENVEVTIFDDFTRDPRAVYDRIVRFLEIDPNFVPELRVVNDFKRVRAPRLKRLVDRPPAAISRAVRRLPRPIYRRLVESVQMLHSTRARRPRISDELWRRLAEELAPEVERVSALLDRDLTHWLRRS